MSTRPARPATVITLLIGGLALCLLATMVAGTAAARVRSEEPTPHGAAGRHAAAPAAATPHGHTRAATPRKPSTTIIAHRGASAYAPENTLASVRLGAAMHADLVEVDVQQTKDDKLVVVHDTTLDRTTNVEHVFPDRAPWRVGDFTLAEIRKLDAGSWKASKYAGEKIPTLGEVLDTLQGTGTGLMLEAKNPELYAGVGKRIAGELRARPFWRNATDARRLIVVSFDWDFQRRFHALAPGYRLGLIGTPKSGELAELARWARFVDPTYGDADADLVRRIHTAGMSTFTWTVNDTDRMRTAIDRHVDGIVTNYPDVLGKQLRGAA